MPGERTALVVGETPIGRGIAEHLSKAGWDARLLPHDPTGAADTIAGADAAALVTALPDPGVGDLESALLRHLYVPRAWSDAFARGRIGEGGIVHVTDSAIVNPVRGPLPYLVSIAALEGLVRSLAADLAPRIRVNAVAFPLLSIPGGSEPIEGDPPPIPLGDPGTPGDIAEAVRFLLEEGTYVTGQILHVDGGAHLTARRRTA